VIEIECFFVRAVRTEDEKGRKTFDLGVDLIELEKLIMSLATFAS